MSEYITDEHGNVIERLIRCDNCRYYDERESSEVYPHRHWCDKLTVYMPPDGFCSWGE